MTPTNAPTVARKLMTADEFWIYCQRPENENKLLELVRGEVIELPSPLKIHGVVCQNIGRILGNYSFQVRKGYVATNDSGVLLERDPDTVRGPDVAYFTDAETFDELHPRWGEVPPVLAVEVQSPSDKQKKLMRKISDYLDNGVPVVWLVNYEERFLTIYRLHQSPQVVAEDEELTLTELPEFRCQVADFFRLPGDKPSTPPSA